MPGFRGGLLVAVASLSAVAACRGGSGQPPRHDAGAGDSHPDGQNQAAYLNTLTTAEELASLAAPEGRGVKYLAPRAGAEPLLPLTAPCYFQNMNRYSWHLQFLNSFPELAALPHDVYTRVVLGASSRRLWGGAVTPWDTVIHPGSGGPGIIAYNIYGDVGSVGADAIAEVDGVLKGCMPFARTLLVFVPETADQRAVLSGERAALAARGVASLFPEELIPGVTHVAYSIGEGYGTLNVVPQGQSLAAYGPRDVVVVESVPNDISIVAGLISRNPQNELGHVNLRLGERHTPNVAVPAIYSDSRVEALRGLLVHLRVTRDTFTLEPATLADAEAFWQAHQPHVPPPRADLAVTELRAFEELRAADGLAFGAKTANLGELTRVLDPANRAAGFGVPFAHYQAFMRATGLDAVVTALLLDPGLRANAIYKRARLKALRDQIKEAPFPATLLTALQAQIAAVFGPPGARLRLRFRSSTNVEDLDTFSGAGLYDSKSGCLADDLDGDGTGPSLCLEPAERAVLEASLSARRQELAEHPDRVWLIPIIDDLTGDLADEKPVAMAVKKVWASLWNERAFDQRDFYGIDHRLAYMGIAVNPTFTIEGASAVAVSNLQPNAPAPLYRLNSQVGSESVVQPEDPTAVAELLSFRRAGDPPQATEIQVHVASNRLPAGTPVWPPEKLAELARLLFRVHDHFAANVYPQLSPLHLDCELKLTAAGDIVFKQARPFVSSDPQ